MQIQINTDHNIDGHEALATHVRGVVEDSLERFSEHIPRVEVHLTDDIGQTSSHKSGQNDKRCVMEARLEGRQPVAVTHHAESLHQAVDGATDKLTRLVESTLERLRDKRSRATVRLPEETQTPEE